MKFEELNKEVLDLTRIFEEKKLIERDAQTQIEVLSAELQTLKLDLLEKEKNTNIVLSPVGDILLKEPTEKEKQAEAQKLFLTPEQKRESEERERKKKR